MKKEKLKELVSKMREYLDEKGVFQVDMDKGKLELRNNNFPCGCHAGFISAVLGAPDGTDWKESAQNLNIFLGFYQIEDLEDWAWWNSEIWGNEAGLLMFFEGSAFGLEEDVFSARKIVEHWEGVLERLEGRG